MRNFQITTEERQVFDQIIKDAEKEKLDINFQVQGYEYEKDPLIKMLNNKFYYKRHIKKAWDTLNDYDDLFLIFYKGKDYIGWLKWSNWGKGKEVIADWTIDLENYLPCLR